MDWKEMLERISISIDSVSPDMIASTFHSYMEALGIKVGEKYFELIQQESINFVHNYMDDGKKTLKERILDFFSEVKEKVKS